MVEDDGLTPAISDSIRDRVMYVVREFTTSQENVSIWRFLSGHFSRFPHDPTTDSVGVT